VTCRERDSPALRADSSLLEHHVHALFTHDARGRIVHVNEPSGRRAAAPRFYLGRSLNRNLVRVGGDVPDALADALAALAASEPVVDDLRTPPRHAARYERMLSAARPVATRWSGPAFRFADLDRDPADVAAVTELDAAVLRGGFEAWLADVRDWQPFVAYLVDARAVALCASVRITRDVHEAGVETLPAFRGRGYAADVVGAWARRVRALNAVPLYSTSWDNRASLRVAEKLRLVPYGSDYHLT